MTLIYLLCYNSDCICKNLDPKHTFDKHLVLAIKLGVT
jgi:hypothetical protein